MPRSHAFSLFHHFLGMGCGAAGIISSVISIEYYVLLYSSVQLEGCCLFKSIILAVNVIVGDYQFGITQSHSFQMHWWPCQQDLLIAAGVMYDYFRWFPQGNVCDCDCVSTNFIALEHIYHHYL